MKMSLPGQEGYHWFKLREGQEQRSRSIKKLGVLNNIEERLEHSGAKREW